MDEGEIHDLLLDHCWFKSPSFDAQPSNGSSGAGLRLYEGILRNILTHGGREAGGEYFNKIIFPSCCLRRLRSVIVQPCCYYQDRK